MQIRINVPPSLYTGYLHLKKKSASVQLSPIKSLTTMSSSTSPRFCIKVQRHVDNQQPGRTCHTTTPIATVVHRSAFVAAKLRYPDVVCSACAKKHGTHLVCFPPWVVDHTSQDIMLHLLDDTLLDYRHQYPFHLVLQLAFFLGIDEAYLKTQLATFAFSRPTETYNLVPFYTMFTDCSPMATWTQLGNFIEYTYTRHPKLSVAPSWNFLKHPKEKERNQGQFLNCPKKSNIPSYP